MRSRRSFSVPVLAQSTITFVRRPGQRQTPQSSAPVESQFDGLRIVLTRKAIKNLYLRVKPPDGHLEISAPVRMKNSTIENFVRSRRPWIDEMRDRVQISAANQAAQGAVPEAQKWPPQRRRDAQKRMNARLEVLLPKWTAIVGKAPTNISLRPMKTRWGSCTPRTGRIRLNLELADLPEQFLEYVLVHELTHLRASGHGVQFQRLMDRYLPSWRQLRGELNKYIIL